MDEHNQADISEAPAASPEEVSETETTQAPSQEKDPVQTELERVESKPKRSKREQLLYTKQRVEKQLADLNQAEGVEEDDTRPLTHADLKRIRETEAVETALNLAESIENEHERRLAKYHLENTIRPSGDPQTDLKNAVALVNAVKNVQKAEDSLRFQKTRQTSSAPSAPAKQKSADELTEEETKFMNRFHLTKEEVIAARK